MCGAREPRRDESFVEIPRGVVAEVVAGDVEQAHVVVAPHPAGAGLEDPGHERERGGEPGHVVHDRNAVALRRAVRGSGEMQVSGLRLHEEVESRPGRPFPVAPVGREMDADDGLVAPAELFVREAELVRLIPAEVPEHRFAGRGEVAEHLPPGVRFEVEPEAALVAVEALVEVAVPGTEEERTDPAAELAVLSRVLDLDDLRAEIGEIGRAERPRPVLLDGEDAQSLEGQHG